MTTHRLLARQLKRHASELPIPSPEWSALLEAISAYYVEIDRERELIQNALDVNSAELTALNERLRARNEELLRTMLNSLSEGVYAVDRRGRFIFMNRTAEQIFGRKEKDMIGRKARDFLEHMRPDGVRHRPEDCPLHPAASDSGSAAGEEYILHEDGHGTPVAFRSNPLRQEGRRLGALVSFNDISDRLQTEERIHQLAFYDPLTGLPNRRLLMDRLSHAMATSARKAAYGAVLFIDVDQFKDINDTLGHESGDALLKEVAARLLSELRAEDTVARFGGDEFVVILEDLGADKEKAALLARHVGEKMLTGLRRPFQLDGKDRLSSASIGIVMFLGDDETLDEILKRSDLAMYNAKNMGRNLCRFFDPAMQSELEKRTRLETELGRSLAEEHFRLFYQKRVDRKGNLCGAEALLRWLAPDRGVVMPTEFIPASEKSGLIVPLGRWVLEEACRRLKTWADLPAARNMTLSVNVSAREFRQPDFVAQVREALDASGADPTLLELEITESMLLENIEDLVRKMRALGDLGVTFSLDDFGTGYSSLSYLKTLPLHKLKIDQSFVRDLETDKNDEAIVQTIIQIGKTLGLGVIAEGVETPSQREKLESLGCHHFQGFLFGRPMSWDDFAADLRTVASRHVA